MNRKSLSFDYRFDPDADYWRGPGTRPTHDWLRDLRLYQEICGIGKVPPKTHQPFGPLSQWVERMRRYADSGKLPFRIAAELAGMGVPLELDGAKQTQATAQEEASFERNLTQLQDWMRGIDTPIANLTYLASRNDAQARKCYAFLEHMRLKRRQGFLKAGHLNTLNGLELLVNEIPLMSWLSDSKSLRDIEKMLVLNDPFPDLYWKQLNQVELAEWRQRSIREGWRLAIYVPGQGIEPVLGCDVENGEICLKLASEEILFHPAPRVIVGDCSGTLVLWGFPEKILIFRMRQQPAIKAPLSPVRIARGPTCIGPDTGRGKPLETGSRFGALEILGRVNRPTAEMRSGHFYQCRCDCGQFVIRQRDAIVERDYATCGCGIHRNLAGQVFGRLTVLNEYRRLEGPGRNTEWKALCTCGTQTWVRATALKSGKTRSCGCLRGQPRAAT